MAAPKPKMKDETKDKMAALMKLFAEEMLYQSHKESKTGRVVCIEDLERILPRLLMDWN